MNSCTPRNNHKTLEAAQGEGNTKLNQQRSTKTNTESMFWKFEFHIESTSSSGPSCIDRL